MWRYGRRRWGLFLRRRRRRDFGRLGLVRRLWRRGWLVRGLFVLATSGGLVMIHRRRFRF